MISAFDVNGKEVRVLEDGYMVNREIWDEEIAIALAKKENIEQLTDEHWEVIYYLRKYYDEYWISPNIKILTKHMKKKMGDDHFNTKRLYEIFPRGPAYQGCKIAGLPRPKACIDG